jgi:hypothetical protein
MFRFVERNRKKTRKSALVSLKKLPNRGVVSRTVDNFVGAAWWERLLWRRLRRLEWAGKNACPLQECIREKRAPRKDTGAPSSLGRLMALVVG